MKTKPGEGMEMSASPIDRILAGEEELIPASGFVASVMERIEEEARVPAPIAFPWRRAVPGMVLAVGVGRGACDGVHRSAFDRRLAGEFDGEFLGAIRSGGMGCDRAWHLAGFMDGFAPDLGPDGIVVAKIPRRIWKERPA